MSLRFLLLLASVLPATAASGSADDGSCRNGAFPSEQSAFALARVIGASRLYLLGDTGGCPAKGEHACRQRSYVVPGDTLITGRDRGGHRCAFFPNKVGGSAGWVDAARLQGQPVPTPTLPAWAGTWRDGDDRLMIEVRGGQLHVAGDAYWPSANPTPEVRPYGPNMGQVDALAVPAGDTAVFQDATCTLRAQLLGDYLIVADNSACGGMNVRFNGVYRRTRTHP